MKTSYKAIIVVPTIREKSIKEFLENWHDEFQGHQVFVVEDNPKRTFKIKGDNVVHFSWQDIEKDLGKDAWIINRRDGSVDSYGIYKAWQEKPDMIVMLSDDCLMFEDDDFLNEHWEKLNLNVSTDWLNPLWSIYPRGYPYKNRSKPVMMNMGLWDGIPDVDGATQLTSEILQWEIPNLVVPHGIYFAVCEMNVAFRPEATPYMYQFASNRFGDIWMGVRAKREFDKLGWAMTIGDPIIYHSRASNPYKNLEKESIHLEENEEFYKNPIPKEYQNKIDIWMNLFKNKSL